MQHSIFTGRRYVHLQLFTEQYFIVNKLFWENWIKFKIQNLPTPKAFCITIFDVCTVWIGHNLLISFISLSHVYTQANTHGEVAKIQPHWSDLIMVRNTKIVSQLAWKNEKLGVFSLNWIYSLIGRHPVMFFLRHPVRFIKFWKKTIFKQSYVYIKMLFWSNSFTSRLKISLSSEIGLFTMHNFCVSCSYWSI